MTTHADADAEVAALRTRFEKVNITKDEWVKKVDVLLKEWTLLDNTVNELNSWVVKDKTVEGENTFSLKKWNLLSANSRISSPQRKLLFRVCKIYKKTKKTERCQVLWLKDEIVQGRYLINPAGDQDEVFSHYHSFIHSFLSMFTLLSNMKKTAKTQAMVIEIFTHLEN